MGKEIIRLDKDDYEELIWVLNTVFSESNVVPVDMEKALPKMCKPDNEHMNKHFAIRENGSIKSVVGVYPLPAIVAGMPVKFSTVGNIATMKDSRGKGYMSLLVDAAMEELKRIGADASRLGGKRSRYQRYGFEPCGTVYRFTLNKNIALETVKPNTNIVFKKLNINSPELEAGLTFHRKNKFLIRKETVDEYYDTITAWRNIPYGAYTESGEFVGVVGATPDKSEITELDCKSSDVYKDIILSWLNINENTVVSVMPHMTEEIMFLWSINTSLSVHDASQFAIFNFKKIIEATLKLKAEYSKIPDFEHIIEIKDTGRFLLKSENNITLCTDTKKSPDVILERGEASRYLFGPLPANVINKGCVALPLPLTWNLQDRV